MHLRLLNLLARFHPRRNSGKDCVKTEARSDVVRPVECEVPHQEAETARQSSGAEFITDIRFEMLGD